MIRILRLGLSCAAVLVLAFFLLKCTDDKETILLGKWQSLNDRFLSIEYDINQKKHLVRLNVEKDWSIKSDTLLIMSSNYQIVGRSNNRLRLVEKVINDGVVQGSDDVSVISEVEFINDDRIIIYFYKHHGILDLADEFARTSSPYKFDSIMQAIMDVPE